MTQLQHCTELRNGTLGHSKGECRCGAGATRFHNWRSGVGFVAGNGGVGTKRVKAPPFFGMYFYLRWLWKLSGESSGGFLVGLRSNENGTVLEWQIWLRVLLGRGLWHARFPLPVNQVGFVPVANYQSQFLWPKSPWKPADRFRSNNMILALGECHVESQNSGQRGTVFWNHSRLLCPRLFVGGHSGLKPGRTLRGMVACAKGPSGVWQKKVY